MSATYGPLDAVQILQFLPHRAPFLLVDRIDSITHREQNADLGSQVVGIKQVTINEPYFQGHFPGYPIVPGVLLVESLAQVASFVLYSEETAIQLRPAHRCLLVGVNHARFRKPALPGMSLRLEASVIRHRQQAWYFQGSIFAGEDRLMTAELTLQLTIQPEDSR